MLISPLEKEVLKHFLAEFSGPPVGGGPELDLVGVESRDFTSVGFFATLAPVPSLNLFDPDRSFRWTAVGGRINGGIEVGFVVYVDEGTISTIEGFTYGDPWPVEIKAFELHPLRFEE